MLASPSDGHAAEQRRGPGLVADLLVRRGGLLRPVRRGVERRRVVAGTQAGLRAPERVGGAQQLRQRGFGAGRLGGVGSGDRRRGRGTRRGCRRDGRVHDLDRRGQLRLRALLGPGLEGAVPEDAADEQQEGDR